VAQPDKRLGELLVTSSAGQLAQLIKFMKENNKVEELQQEFYKKSQNPLGK
jgi:hypothetical protein